MGQTLELITADGQWNRSRVTPEAMEKFARVNRALEDFAAENQYDALCVSCWSKFQEVYGLAVCAAMSRLNESGIVTPCEGDVPAAVNMLVFNALNGRNAALKDLVSIDEEDDSINLWHCGVAPKCWANQNGVTWDEHFNIGQYQDGQWQGQGVVANLSFKSGTVTVCSMNNRFDNLFILTGDVMPHKKSYYGSSGWINHLAVNGQKISLPDLINTISVGRLNHHYPIAFGDLTGELNEFAAWKELTVLDPIAYKPYLQQPTPG
ncbi:MAG: hypothetical protein GY850_39705 [bacterium]|nr:hypothetical protein [bacterium]